MAKIAVDAGHGLYTAGKRCLKSLDPNETREWIINDRVADEVVRQLQAMGHQTLRVDDIDGSTDVSLAERVRKANVWGADFYMSVHHDAGVGGRSAGGTTVYVSKNCTNKSKIAQAAIYERAVEYGNLKGNRYDGTLAKSLYVLNNTKMPACLIECGFMDSSTDIKYILDPAWSIKMGQGIAKGICDVFGGKAVETKPVTVTSPTPAVTKTKLSVDGDWNKTTTCMSQKVLGTSADSIISNQPSSNKKYLPAANTKSWQFKDKNYKGGSALIKAIQKLVGATADGYCGKNTVKAMQKFLNAKGFNCGSVDGYMGTKTVKAWQQYINSRL